MYTSISCSFMTAIQPECHLLVLRVRAMLLAQSRANTYQVVRLFLRISRLPRSPASPRWPPFLFGMFGHSCRSQRTTVTQIIDHPLIRSSLVDLVSSMNYTGA